MRFSCLLTFALLLTVTLAVGQYNGVVPYQSYLDVGAGYAIINDSHIANAGDTNHPVHLFVEKGDLNRLWAWTIGVDFNAAYMLNGFTLSPNFLFVAPKFHLPIRDGLSLFATAGPTFERSSLALDPSDDTGGIAVKETSHGVGAYGAAGIQLELSRLTFGTKLMVFRSSKNFSLGSFEPQAYQTGSERILLTLALTLFAPDSYEDKCQTYK